MWLPCVISALVTMTASSLLCLCFSCGELSGAGTHRRAPTSPTSPPSPSCTPTTSNYAGLLSCAGMHYLPECMPPCVCILATSLENMGILLNRICRELCVKRLKSSVLFVEKNKSSYEKLQLRFYLFLQLV